MTSAVFLECAEVVADRWRELSRNGSLVPVDEEGSSSVVARAEVLAQASYLSAHLRQHHQRVLASAGAEDVRRLGILPILSVSHPVTGETVLVSYAECTAPPDRLLTGILKPCPSEELLVPQVLWPRLGLKSPPAPEDVIRSLERLPEALTHGTQAWPLVGASPQDVILAAYEYLEPQWDRLAENLRAQFSAAPAMIIGRGQAIPPKRLFFKVASDLSIAPWIMQVPNSYRPFEGVLAQLGVKDRPSAKTICEILGDVLRQRENSGLDPSEIHSLLHTLEYLRRLAPDMLRRATAIAVPAADGCVKRKEDCIYSDALHLTGKVDLRKMQLTFAFPSISEQLANACQLKRLSEVVQLCWRARPVPCEQGDQLPSKLSKRTISLLMEILQERYAGQVRQKGNEWREQRAHEKGAPSSGVLANISVRLLYPFFLRSIVLFWSPSGCHCRK